MACAIYLKCRRKQAEATAFSLNEGSGLTVAGEKDEKRMQHVQRGKIEQQWEQGFYRHLCEMCVNVFGMRP